MQCRQTIVGWLKRFILLSFTLGITLVFYHPALALVPARQLAQTATDIVEVSPPETIQKLRPEIDQYSPQVKILSPAADQLVKDDSVSVRFEVRDLPIFKDETLGLGPHLSVFLDNQPYQEVYDLSQPLVFKKLAPGTHTIRAIANRPWSESFKNPGAYAQTTFHIFTRTEENNPSPDRPLLTYGQPQGLVGTDTVLFDFYLSNLPKTGVNVGREGNWRVLVSINGSTFYINDWQPLYLQGLKPGKNWVRFELTDQRGQKIENAFNDTIRVVEVQENSNDVRSKLAHGDLSAIDAGGIVNPNYKRPQTSPIQPPVTQPIPTPSSEPKSKATPAPPSQLEAPPPNVPVAPTVKQPSPTPAPQPKSSKPPTVKPSPTPLPKPEETQPKGQEKQSAGESIKAPTQSKNEKQPSQSKGEQKTSKAQNSQSSSPSPKAEPSQLQEKKAQAKEQPTTPAKSKSLEKPSAAKSVLTPSTAEKDNKPKSATPKTPTSSSAAKSEKLQPKEAADPRIPESPATKSASPKQVPAPIPSKAVPKEIAPKSIGAEKDGSPMGSDSSKQDKGMEPGDSSSLKKTFTKFWDQIRPSQEQTQPPKAAPSLEKKESSKDVEPKLTPIPSSAPVNKSPVTATPPLTKSAQQKAAQRQGPATTTKSPQPPAPDRSKPSASRPIPDQTQSTQGRDSRTKDAEKAPPLLIPPTPQPQPPKSSVFSSWRDRWQQQQKGSAPTQEDTTSAKTAPTKAPAIPSTDKNSPSQEANKETTSDKTVPPKKTDTTSVVKQEPAEKIEEKKESRTSNSSVPAAKSAKPESVFSALRNRWQQQKQLMSSPPKETTSNKPVLPKPASEPSILKSAPSSSMSKGMAPAPTSTPKFTDAPGVVNPTPKAASQDKKDEAKSSASSGPDAKAAQPETSVFSSWRDRWHQQQQQQSSPTPAMTPPVQTPPSKSTEKTTVQPKSSSNPVKTKAPVKTAPTQTTQQTNVSKLGGSTQNDSKSTEKATVPKPDPSNVAKQAPSKTTVSSEGDTPPSNQSEIQKPDPVTFDPGVFYRRFLSKDQTSSPPTQAKEINPVPSS